MKIDYTRIAIGLLALQLAAFAWRINREVSMEAQGQRTWLPLSDWFNVVALVGVAGFCLVWPIAVGGFGRLSKSVLAAGVVLIAFYPVCQASHYRLFSPHGRAVYQDGAPWITGQEVVASLVAALLAAFAASAAWCNSN